MSGWLTGSPAGGSRGSRRRGSRARVFTAGWFSASRRRASSASFVAARGTLRRRARIALDLDLDAHRPAEEALAHRCEVGAPAHEPARTDTRLHEQPEVRTVEMRERLPALERGEEPAALALREDAEAIEHLLQRRARRRRRQHLGRLRGRVAARLGRFDRARGRSRRRGLGAPRRCAARRRGAGSGGARRGSGPRPEPPPGGPASPLSVSRRSSSSRRATSSATSSPAASVASRTIAISSTAKGSGAHARSSCSFTSARNMRRRRAGSARLRERAQRLDLRLRRLDELGAVGRDTQHGEIAQQLQQRLAEPLGVDARLGRRAQQPRAPRRDRGRCRPRRSRGSSAGRSGRGSARPLRRRPRRRRPRSPGRAASARRASSPRRRARSRGARRPRCAMLSSVAISRRRADDLGDRSRRRS